MVQLAHKF